MARLVLILLLSCAYVGCATTGTRDAGISSERPSISPDSPGAGGTVRLLVGSSLRPEDVVLANVGLPVTTAGLAREIQPPTETYGSTATGAGCWTIEIEPRHTGPDGEPVPAGEPIARWESLLREGDPVCRQMLAPVLGVSAFCDGLADHARGLQEIEGRLTVCTSVPAPDLRTRLVHPRLWFLNHAPGEEDDSGPGPFQVAAEGVLEANRRQELPGPRLDRVEMVPDRDAPELLLRLNEADLGVLLGRNAAPVLDGGATGLETKRIREWDRVYFLWFNVNRRWVNDPRFRRWFGGLLDRDAAVRYLLDGQGEPAFHLLSTGEQGAAAEAFRGRPVSAGSTPRLQLAYDDSDPHAGILAARMKAVAELNGVVLQLLPAGSGNEQSAIVLGSHQPFTEEPLLGLLDSLAGLPSVPGETIRALQRGAESERPDLRLRAAAAVEAGLLEEARMVPLVRVHAWLVSDPDLRDVRTGPPGMLLLEDARWIR